MDTVAEGETWFCPLIHDQILDAECVEINLDLEGAFASDAVSRLAAKLGLMRRDIEHVCLKCRNNPLAHHEFKADEERDS